MPIPPPPVTAPYPMLETVLNTARTRLNDAIASLGGDILTDVQPFTGTMTNAAWRQMQIFLCNLGYSKYKKRFRGYAYPVVSSTDPSSDTFLSWTQFWDGTGYFSAPTVDLLPQDFIAPLKVAERPTGSNQVFAPMTLAPDGLPEGMKTPWNGFFEWKNDRIFMPGSTRSMDLEIYYAAFDSDFETTDDILGNPATTPPTTPANMPVPIMRSESCFANFLCAECASGRDDIDAGSFLAAAEKDAKFLMNNSDIKLKQRRPVQRRPYARGTSQYSVYSNNQGY